MNLEQQAFNPNNPYENYGIGHNAIVNQVLADYGAQISQITDVNAKEDFIINACMNTAVQLYGEAQDPRPAYAMIPGYTGLFSELDIANQWQSLFMGLPTLTPTAAQKIIDILGPLTTIPVETEADLVNVLNDIKNTEDQLLQDPTVEASVLKCTSVLKFSLVCWWADPNPPGSGGTAYFRYDVAAADVLGAAIAGGPTFGLAALEGAAAASTIWSLCTS